ncbi:MAG: hypothetical protein ABI960_11635, partial [Candidatus Eisenbacteria bacterium]
STLLAIMGRMAAYTGQPVTWDQALNSTESLAPKAYAWGEAALRARRLHLVFAALLGAAVLVARAVLTRTV